MLCLDQATRLLKKAAYRLGAVPADHVGRESRCRPDRRKSPDGGGRRARRRSPPRGSGAAIAGLSRKATCCDQGSPTSSFKPASCAASSSHSGGTVNTRTVLMPASRHQREIAYRPSRGRGMARRAARRERAVGDPFDEVLGLPGKEELALHADRARAGRCSAVARRRGQRPRSRRFRSWSCREAPGNRPPPATRGWRCARITGDLSIHSDRLG